MVGPNPFQFNTTEEVDEQEVGYVGTVDYLN
jgi:hypothetical protein